MIFMGSGPVLLKSLYFCDFSGGVGGPDRMYPASASTRECLRSESSLSMMPDPPSCN